MLPAERDTIPPDDDPDLLEEVLAAHARVVPGYRLLDQLGFGGQGDVYRAEAVDSGEHVAIKFLARGYLADREARARFEREARILEGLHIEHVVRYRGHGITAQHVPYLVLDLVDGLQLDQYLRTHPLDVRDRLRLFETLCAAVADLHARDLVHRDLCPANVLVRAPDDLTLVDFGIACALGQADRSPRSPRFTTARTLMGRPSYMSPEQAAGLAGLVDARSDVYSLGVMLYEVLSGKLPFDVPDDPRRVFEATYLAQPRPLALALARGEPRPRSVGLAALQAIVAKALEKDRERRQGHAGVLAEDLRQFIATDAHLVDAGQRHLRLWRALMVAGAAVATTAITVAVARRPAGAGGGEPHARRLPDAAASTGPQVQPDDGAAAATMPAPRLRFALTGALAPPGHLVFHPHNRWIRVSAREGDGVAVWDLTTGAQVASSSSGTRFDQWSPDGRTVYTPGMLFDPRLGVKYRLEHTESAHKAFWSADGTRVAVMTEWLDPWLRVFAVADGALVFAQEFRYRHVAQADLSPDGRRLAATGGQPRAGTTLWDVDSGHELGPLRHRGGAKTWVRFSRDSRRLCTFAWTSGRVEVFDAGRGDPIEPPLAGIGPGHQHDRLYSTEQDFIILRHAASPAAVVAWDVERERMVGRLELEDGSATVSVLAGNGHLALSADRSGCVFLWQPRSGRSLRLAGLAGAPVVHLAFSFDGTLCASATADGRVHVWDLPKDAR